MPLEGTDLPLWGLEVDPEEATQEFKTYSKEANTGKHWSNLRAAATAAAP